MNLFKKMFGIGRYPIGQRCVIVKVGIGNEKFLGMTCTVVGHDVDGCDYEIDTDGFKNPFGKILANHENLKPIDDDKGDANTVTSWDDCPFQPEREVTPA